LLKISNFKISLIYLLIIILINKIKYFIYILFDIKIYSLLNYIKNDEQQFQCKPFQNFTLNSSLPRLNPRSTPTNTKRPCASTTTHRKAASTRTSASSRTACTSSEASPPEA